MTCNEHEREDMLIEKEDEQYDASCESVFSVVEDVYRMQVVLLMEGRDDGDEDEYENEEEENDFEDDDEFEEEPANEDELYEEDFDFDDDEDLFDDDEEVPYN